MLKEVEERMVQEIVALRRRIINSLKTLLCVSLLVCVLFGGILISNLIHHHVFNAIVNGALLILNFLQFTSIWKKI